MGRALGEGLITNNGPYVLDFEALLTKYLGGPTICFSSGTAALTTMLMAVGVERQEVIIPSFTFAATANAVLAAGGIPVFADINAKTMTISAADVERKITRQTVAILAVDTYGVAADYDMLEAIAKHHDIWLLRDSAPAFGTKTSARAKVTGCYSFHATKAFAVGEGGCLVSRDDNLIRKAKEIRNFGLKNERWNQFGINGKMTEISAMIGIESLKTFPVRLMDRTKTKMMLDAHFDQITGLTTFPSPEDQITSWCYCPVLVREEEFGCNRDELHRRLAEAGIMTRKYYPALHKEPFAVSHDLHGADLPVTEYVANRVLAFPCYESMSLDEIMMLVNEVAHIKESLHS